MREVGRVLWQVLGFATRTRRPMLWLLVVFGAAFVAVAVASSFAAPVLIYPVL